MFKKRFKFIWRLIIFILILLFFFAVIRPAYINYKQNKKEVIVDQSGERATSKNKLKENLISEENNSNGDNENSWKLERKEDYDAFTFDDRILLYEGTLNSDSMNSLMEILIEDIESPTYSKIDINLNGIDISYDNKENYSSSLNNFKNSVFHDHHKLFAIVDKPLILSGSCGITVILLNMYILFNFLLCIL